MLVRSDCSFMCYFIRMKIVQVLKMQGKQNKSSFFLLKFLYEYKEDLLVSPSKKKSVPLSSGGGG